MRTLTLITVVVVFLHHLDILLLVMQDIFSVEAYSLEMLSYVVVANSLSNEVVEVFVELKGSLEILHKVKL